ncbi:MAG: helix-turn-helix domain-containing protein [bacterium]
MDDIGKKLRETRKQLQKSLEEVHDETRVSIEHLRLLEENNFTFLPETYVKSFLKTYAESLGLDSNEIVQAYQGRQEKSAEEAEDEIEVVSGETAVEMEKPATATHLEPMRSFVEYALAIGSFVLLVGVLLVYIQYRSQIFAFPVDRLSYSQQEDYFDLAQITVQEPESVASGTTALPLQLQVKAQDNILLRLTVDKRKTTEHTLAAEQNMVWLAENSFDLQLRRVEPRVRPDGVQPCDTTGGVVRVSFSRDSVHE